MPECVGVLGWIYQDEQQKEAGRMVVGEQPGPTWLLQGDGGEQVAATGRTCRRSALSNTLTSEAVI